MFFSMENMISAWLLLFVVWSHVAAVNVDIPEDLYEFASGDNGTLPCRFETSDSTAGKPIIISWSIKEDGDAQQIMILSHYNPADITDIKSEYEGRVSLDIDINEKRANLVLSSITPADSKKYYCRVQIPGDSEGNPADSTHVAVLAAPSPPICKVQEEVEYGQNVNLTCHSDKGHPPPTYRWESRDAQNMSRVLDPTTTDKDGILSLFSVSKETSGNYICTSTNKFGSASCNITLTVPPPKRRR